MPRINTKRGEHWGTGWDYKKKAHSTVALKRTLSRLDRGDEWRKARNERKRMNKGA